MIRFFITLILLLSVTVTGLAEERPSTKHEVYFEGTDYELNIYKINGRTDGKTMFIVGGIQGDEPGGFFYLLICIPTSDWRRVI